jgi:hypothetical protein
VGFKHVEAFLVEAAVEDYGLELFAAELDRPGLSEPLNPIRGSNVNVNSFCRNLCFKGFLLLSKI